MTLTCVHCGQRFSSVIIERDLALTQSSQELIQHAIKSHPDIVANMQAKLTTIIQLVSSKLSFTMLMDMVNMDTNDPRQNYVVEKFNEVQLEIANQLDMDVMLEEEIDEESEQEEVPEEQL